MFGILVSAANVALAWVFRVVVVKALLFGVLFLITTEVAQALVGKLADTQVNGLGGLIAGLPSGVLYFMHLFRLDVGLPMLLSAHGVAFAIRRLPIVG